VKSWLFALLFSIQGVGHAGNIGVRPDCSERKTDVEELKKIAQRKEIHTMVDFLRAIPPGSLQTFTFVKGTSSFQHHKTDARWPRVLRLSADAKVALSFVCNPESQDYGRVEILHYSEPPVARWRSISLDFRSKKIAAHGLREDDIFPARGGRRLQEDSATCAKCHSLDGKSVSNLLPIVPQYKTWDGFFGSDDDVLHTGTEEKKEFQSFLRRAKSDPCFGTLPWPVGGNPAYALYPFHEGFPEEKLRTGRYSISEETKQIKIRNYHLRPNLKLTDAYSHLMAQRLAWRFLRSPEYRKVAPFLMMEAANCGAEKVAAALEGALPGYKSPAALYLHTFMDPRTEMSWTKQLYGVGERLGIQPREWTMHFNSPADPYYNTGAAGDSGRDISIGKMAQGVLLSHLAGTYPELQKDFRMARSVSKFFAPQDFSCIDDVAGQIAIDEIGQKNRLCERLSKLGAEGAGSAYAKLEIPVENEPGTVAEETIGPHELLARLGSKLESIQNLSREKEVHRGRELVTSSCKGCHGETNLLPKSYHFLADEAELESRLRRFPEFLWTAISYVESGRMPKGQKLKEDEKRAIQLYLLDRAQRRTSSSR